MELPDAPAVVAVPGARPATASDVGVLAHLHLRAVDDLAHRRGGQVLASLRRRGDDESAVAASLRDTLARADRAVFCGCLGDVVVGLAVVELPTDDTPGTEAMVAELYVQPEARGVGVGDELLRLAIRAARSAGATGIDSVALPGDRDTKNFFEENAMVARAIVVHAAFSDTKSDSDTGA